MIEFSLNGKKIRTDAEADTPLLWVIRDEFGLKGTKFGCGIAMCGACTVHLNGSPVRSCSLPINAIANTDIRTIEGLENQHPLQKAWVDHQVPQCGYCQSGQIMQAAALLATNAMTYVRIKEAIKDVAMQSNSVVQIYTPKTATPSTQGVS